MKPIIESPFVQEVCAITSNMYRLGWDERNGGNISLWLDEGDVAPYLDLTKSGRKIALQFDAKEIAGALFLVTGTGKYFRNVAAHPEENLGVIRICPDGQSYEILWGLIPDSRPTSELPTHLMNHITRRKADPDHRVVMHCHPTNLLAMTFVHSLDEREFTRTLWRTCTECLVVFPDGVGVVPWMVCGNNAIGEKTAEKIVDRRAVVWAQHGLFCTGRDIDETFGLIETIEKAAEIYMKVLGHPVVQTITDDNLRQLAREFPAPARQGYLD